MRTLTAAKRLSTIAKDRLTGGFAAALVLAAFAGAPSAHAAALSFQAEPAEPAASATAVEVADLNRDGFLDTATVGGSAVTVNLGNSSTQHVIPVGSGATDLALADFNHDGLLDVATSNDGSGPDTISIRYSVGFGASGGVAELPAGAGPSSIAAGNLNGDAWPDIAVANRDGDSVTTLLGSVNGSFVPGASTSIGGPTAVEIADFEHNGGGDDLAIASEGFDPGLGIDQVLIYRNNNPGFGPAGGCGCLYPSLPSNTDPTAVAVGDIDLDGRADVVSANFGTDDVSVFLRNDLGGVDQGQRIQIPVSGQFGFVRDVALGDLNRDGRLDLVVAAEGAVAAPFVALGTGTGTFAPLRTVQPAQSFVQAVAIADMTRDGAPDVLYTDFGPGTVTTLRNTTPTAAPQFAAQPITTSLPSSVRDLAGEDLDRDGIRDLVAADLTGVRVLRGTGAGGFQVGDHVPTAGTPNYLATGDLNRDGRADLVVASASSPAVSILLATGSGYATAPALTVDGSASGLGIADFDRDGRLDVVTADDQVHFHLGDGAGSFAPPTTLDLGLSPHALAVGELNGDGVPDVAVGVQLDSSNRIVVVQPNPGNFGGFGFTHYFAGCTGLGDTIVRIADLNRDGRQDALLQELGACLNVWLGGGPPFPPLTTFAGGGNHSRPTLADFNRDGILDLAWFASARNAIEVRPGAGDGTFAGPLADVGLTPGPFAADDFDGDGTADLAMDGGNSLDVYLNRVPNSTPAVAVSGGSTAYTENGPGAAVDSGLTLSDQDDVTLTGATARIAGNFAPGQDQLEFTAQVGISGSFASGALTLSGTAPVEDYQAVLRSVRYRNSSDSPSTAQRTVELRVRDEALESAPVTRTVSVTSVDDPPVLGGVGGGRSYTENDPPVALLPGLTVSDLDGTHLTGAVLDPLPGTQHSADDRLTFTPAHGIGGSYDAAAGRLTLTGTATLAQYQEVVRSVRFHVEGDAPQTFGRVVNVRVTGVGGAQSAGAGEPVAVTAVNDAPTVTLAGFANAYAENAAPVAIDASLTVADPDHASLTGATVTISAGFAPGDVLGFANQAGIFGAWNAATGELTLSGGAPLSSYRQALRAVTFATGGDTPSTVPRTITVRANDGVALGSPSSRQMNVIPVNDVPVLSTTAGGIAYTENDPAVAVDPGLTVTDADHANLAGATVRIASGRVAGDVLGFAGQSGIAGSFDPGSGVLTLSGTASLAQYQQALRSVTYMSTSDDPSSAQRTIGFVARDVQGESVEGTRTVAVTAVNDPLVFTLAATPLAYTENDGLVPLDPALAVSDPDGQVSHATVRIAQGYVEGQDLLAYVAPPSAPPVTVGWVPATGTLTLTGPVTPAQMQDALRGVRYQNVSDNPQTAQRSVAVEVFEQLGASVQRTRAIQVTSVNDGPVVGMAAAPLTYQENDPPLVVDGGATVADPENHLLRELRAEFVQGYAQGQDVLHFTIPGAAPLIGSFNAATGRLTVCCNGTRGEWEQVLRSLRYENTSDAPSSAVRRIAVRVSDQEGFGAAAERDVAVTAVDDPPSVLATAGQTGYTENGPPVPVDPGGIVADPDSPTLAGAGVRFAAGYEQAEDRLGYSAPAGNPVTGQFDGGSGELALSGPGSPAQYQEALRAVTYENLSDDPHSGARTLELSVSEPAGMTATSSRGLVVAAVNDAPAVSASPGSVTYTEADPAVAVDPGLGVSDLDDATLVGATVAIGAGFAAGEDELDVTLQGAITGTYDGGAGVLELTGGASPADYEAVLRSVTYRNSSASPSAAAREVGFVVRDSDDPSPASVRTVTIAYRPPSGGVPTIEGVARAGERLVAEPWQATGSLPIVFDFVWERCDAGGGGCAPIAGATGATYVAVDADVGRTLRVVARADNPAPGTETGTSAVTEVVAPAPVVPGDPGGPGGGAGNEGGAGGGPDFLPADLGALELMLGGHANRRGELVAALRGTALPIGCRSRRALRECAIELTARRDGGARAASLAGMSRGTASRGFSRGAARDAISRRAPDRAVTRGDHRGDSGGRQAGGVSASRLAARRPVRLRRGELLGAVTVVAGPDGSATGTLRLTSRARRALSAAPLGLTVTIEATAVPARGEPARTTTLARLLPRGRHTVTFPAPRGAALTRGLRRELDRLAAALGPVRSARCAGAPSARAACRRLVARGLTARARASRGGGRRLRITLTL